MKLYAECKMTAVSGLVAKPCKRMIGGLSMTASSKLHPAVAGMGLDLKQEDIVTAARLLLLFKKTDEELAAMARESKIADLVQGKDDHECAEHIRNRALEELRDLQKKVKDG